jgi:23S rRNA (cytosine1962-C5)-methyltransferase
VSKLAPARNITIQVCDNTWSEYELLDSGNRQKLERFGDYLLVRSEPKAWWRPTLPQAAWHQAVAIYQDDEPWTFRQPVPREWLLRFADLVVQAKCTDMSKHVGVFPEQSVHWRWLRDYGAAAPGHPRHLLNLFGYTGISSLIAAKVGFGVTHVDASKPALAWAKRNQELSGLTPAPIRWILDDASKFVKREINRKRRYDAILLDPPSFGRGPKGEVWKIERHLTQLLDLCRQVLSDQPLFVLVTMYAIEASSLIIGNLLGDMMQDTPGTIQVGELVLTHTTSTKRLPMAIFGRWERA